MRSELSLKKDIVKNLKSNWIKYVMCRSTGNVHIGSAVLSFDAANGYVIANIPTQQHRQIRYQLPYLGFAQWFTRFAELYEAHPHRATLLPIVVYPKPQMSKRKAIKKPIELQKVIAA